MLPASLAAVACLVGAVLTGPYLLRVGGPPHRSASSPGASLAIRSVGPCWRTRLGIADPVFFIMFGSVAVAGAYWCRRWRPEPRTLPLAAWVVGLPVGGRVTNVLLIDDIRDHDSTPRRAARTAPVRFGLPWTRTSSSALLCFAYAMPLWSWLGLGFSPGCCHLADASGSGHGHPGDLHDRAFRNILLDDAAGAKLPSTIRCACLGSRFRCVSGPALT